MKRNQYELSRLFSWAGLALAVLWLSACGESTSTQNGTSFYCSVSSVSVVSGTNQLLLTLSASGGTANYSVASVTAGGVVGSVVSGGGTFSGSTSGTYLFSSLSSTTLASTTGTVTVTDSSDTAQTASCSFSVGTAVSTSGLACTISPSTTVPTLGASTQFTFSGSGGTAPYSFSNFAPGSNGAITTGITSISTTQSYAAASYSYSGTSTASVTVTDSAGSSNSCSTIVYPGSTGGTSGSLACTAILSPASVYRGQNVYALAQITGGGAGGVVLSSIEYPTASGMTGSFTGPLTAVLVFPYAGSFTITMVIQDSSGATSTCNATQQVY